MKVSIILCVYNEIRVIEQSFQELFEDCEKQQLEYEIIVIDNASTDGTREWLETLTNSKVTTILNFRRSIKHLQQKTIREEKVVQNNSRHGQQGTHGLQSTISR